MIPSTTHRVWVAASAIGEPPAIQACQSALDREKRAADTHARPRSRVRHPADAGPAHQMALKQALPGAWECR